MRVGSMEKILGSMCLSVCLFLLADWNVMAQEEGELSAKQRIRPGIGPGLRAIRQGADGKTYVLASPSPGLQVFDAAGKQVLSINELPASAGAAASSHSLINFGEDCDVDSEGKIYVADRGADLIRVFSPDGTPIRSIPVRYPVSVAALPEGEIGVATLREPHLVIVFDKNGKEVREFGDPEPIAERAELNRFLNIGQLGTDTLGHLYYAFGFLPEPTVRQYDHLGYARQDIQYTALEAMPVAQATRKEIEREELKGGVPAVKRVLTGMGVDRSNGEVWVALNNNLLHFDAAGNRRATYKIYTPSGARLEANTILVRKDDLIIGSDPLGLYLFERPDKKNAK